MNTDTIILTRKIQLVIDSRDSAFIRERASYALNEIQKLYTIERISKEAGLNFEELQVVRNKKADPILKGMWLWMQ